MSLSLRACNEPNRRTVVVTVVLVSMMALMAACSSNPSVEATDTTASDTSAVETSDTTTDDADELVVEGEESAMGEDDNAVTTTTVADDAPETTAGAVLDSAELEAALIAGQSEDLKLPFLYITADQDCDGCAETVSLYYVPAPAPAKASDLVFDGAFVDGAAVDADSVDPILRNGDPRLVAEQLAAFDAAGTLDAFSIDSVSGMVTSWTVDGNTVTLRCLQVDTRPVDLRSEVCRDSLIG